MKKRLLLFLILLSQLTLAQTGAREPVFKVLDVKSPDGMLDFKLESGTQLKWSLNSGANTVILPSVISLTLANGEVLGKSAVIGNAKTVAVDANIATPIYKKSSVSDQYNQLTINFKGNYGLIIRAYNDGVAYRFFTLKSGEITIINEAANFNFKGDHKAYLPFVNDFRNHDKFTTSFEAHYAYMNLSALTADSLAFLPALVEVGDGKKAVVLEADLQDYPGMYLTSGGKQSLQGVFAKYPTEETTGGYHNINYVVNKRAGYIAKTTGTRSFPWRVIVVSNSDKQLADNDMMQRLAQPSRIADLAWIKPGKVAWDWWNDWNLTHVNFVAGINVETYKSYIDFAAANKLDYVIMDEGWSDESDLSVQKIDVPQIVSYGKQKNVGIILWSSWYALHLHTDSLFTLFEKMGIKGLKIDFIDRDDQKMVKSIYEIAQKAANHHLILDCHGMYKPSGIQRTFPNILNFEGVKGLENMKWGVQDQPVYDVTIPFIRMMAGPMDYTPGGMRNANKGDYRPNNANPMTQGTRCHQLAMYCIFEAPLQMLADNPTIYQREQECTDYIASVPTVFDQTEALDGQVGEFVCIARRKGDTWYAGGMTNWSARTTSTNLSFLGDGNYRVTLFEDGVNAGKDATDYKKTVFTVNSKQKFNIKMAAGGGWAARFEKLK